MKINLRNKDCCPTDKKNPQYCHFKNYVPLLSFVHGDFRKCVEANPDNERKVLNLWLASAIANEPIAFAKSRTFDPRPPSLKNTAVRN